MPNAGCLLGPVPSFHTAASFTRRPRQLAFRLIIVVCDISKRIMRMKCDKNYFHVTPEHLTSDRLARRSTEAQTSGTRMLCSERFRSRRPRRVDHNIREEKSNVLHFPGAKSCYLTLNLKTRSWDNKECGLILLQNTFRRKKNPKPISNKTRCNIKPSRPLNITTHTLPSAINILLCV